MAVLWTERSRWALEELTRRGYVAERDGSVTRPDGSKQKLSLIGGGYPGFSRRMVFKGEKVQCTIKVHRLIMYQKLGDALFEDGVEVRHRHDNKQDNSWNSLSTGTRFDNVMDMSGEKQKRGLSASGVANALKTKKLTDAEEDDFLRRYEDGEVQSAMAVEFGVTPRTVSRAVRRARVRRGDVGVSVEDRFDTPRSRAQRKFTDDKETEILRRFDEHSVPRHVLAAELGITNFGLMYIVRRARYHRDAGSRRNTG